MTGITILTAIALIWGGLIIGLIIGRAVPEEPDTLDMSAPTESPRTTFRTPLVRYR